MLYRGCMGDPLHLRQVVLKRWNNDQESSDEHLDAESPVNHGELALSPAKLLPFLGTALALA